MVFTVGFVCHFPQRHHLILPSVSFRFISLSRMCNQLAIWGLCPLLINGSQGFSLSWREHESASEKRKVLQWAWLSSMIIAAIWLSTVPNETKRNRAVCERHSGTFNSGYVCYGRFWWMQTVLNCLTHTVKEHATCRAWLLSSLLSDCMLWFSHNQLCCVFLQLFQLENKGQMLTE